MTTKRFIEYLNTAISKEGINLMTEFFVTFSRFECALKVSGYVIENNNKVFANWGGFLASIRTSFNHKRTDELENSVDYLIQNPPRIQALNNNQLTWRDRVFQKNEQQINKLGQSIRDIRNNLFHGGKFYGKYQEDVSRNYILLKNSIIILNEWLRLNNTVEQNFLGPI